MNNGTYNNQDFSWLHSDPNLLQQLTQNPPTDLSQIGRTLDGNMAYQDYNNPIGPTPTGNLPAQALPHPVAMPFGINSQQAAPQIAGLLNSMSQQQAPQPAAQMQTPQQVPQQMPQQSSQVPQKGLQGLLSQYFFNRPKAAYAG